MTYEIKRFEVDSNLFLIRLDDHNYAKYRISVKVENSSRVVFISEELIHGKNFIFRGKIYLNSDNQLVIYGTSGGIDITDRKKLSDLLKNIFSRQSLDIEEDVLFEHVRS